MKTETKYLTDDDHKEDRTGDLGQIVSSTAFPMQNHELAAFIFRLQLLLPFIPLSLSLLSLAGSLPSVSRLHSYTDQVVSKHSPLKKILKICS